jgi:hypothetical protein
LFSKYNAPKNDWYGKQEDCFLDINKLKMSSKFVKVDFKRKEPPSPLPITNARKNINYEGRMLGIGP